MKLARAVMVAAVLTLAAPAVASPARPVSIFYYPWYSTVEVDGFYRHWSHPGWPFQIASSFFPARGLYSSSDAAVVRAQMAEIARTGVKEVVSSWWGWGSDEDVRLPLVIQAARQRGMSVAAHLEPYPGRSVGTLEADIAHLRELGITRFYVYEPFRIDATQWAAMRTRVTGVQLFAHTTIAGLAAAARFEGLYTYDVLQVAGTRFGGICAQARALRLLCAPSVGPGFDASRLGTGARVRPRRNGLTYDAMWRGAINARADIVTITSYNEWGEGTQIEPARAYGGTGTSAASFESYEGAWGRRGRAAELAYLERTRYWVREYARLIP